LVVADADDTGIKRVEAVFVEREYFHLNLYQVQASAGSERRAELAAVLNAS
jgi:hypothetical protein